MQKDSRVTAFTSLMLILEIVAVLGIGLLVLAEVSQITTSIFISNFMALIRVEREDQLMFQLPSAQQVSLLPLLAIALTGTSTASSPS